MCIIYATVCLEGLEASSPEVVGCRFADCASVAHYSCAGYKSAKSLPRAKYRCPSCRAASVAKALTPAKSAPGSVRLTSAVNSERTPCLCSSGEFCSGCLSLESVSSRLLSLTESTKRENEALKLHILSLEERLHSLEALVTSLQSSSSVGEPNWRSSGTAPRRSRGGGRGRGRGGPFAAVSRGGGGGGAAAAAAAAVGFEQSNTQGEAPTGPRRGSTAKTGNSSSNKPNPFSTNYRIIWGTRFATSESEVRVVLAALLSPEQLTSLVVSKSVKRSAGGLRWWFTLMADPDTLALLDQSWSHSSWVLRRSLARTSVDGRASINAPVCPSHSTGSASTVSPPSAVEAAVPRTPSAAISQSPVSTVPPPLPAVRPVAVSATPRQSVEHG